MDEIPTIEDVLIKHCQENHWYPTSNEKHTIINAMQEWSSLQNQSLIDRVKEKDERIDMLEEIIYSVRPFSEAYKRVCESLGIDKDILGFVEQRNQRISELEKERDELKEGLRKITEHPEESEKKFPSITIATFKQIAINLLTN